LVGGGVVAGGAGGAVTTGAGAGAGAAAAGAAATGAAATGGGADAPGAGEAAPVETEPVGAEPDAGDEEPAEEVTWVAAAPGGADVEGAAPAGCPSVAICCLVAAIDARSWAIAVWSVEIWCWVAAARADASVAAEIALDDRIAQLNERPVTPTVAAATTAEETERLRRRPRPAGPRSVAISASTAGATTGSVTAAIAVVRWLGRTGGGRRGRDGRRAVVAGLGRHRGLGGLGRRRRLGCGRLGRRGGGGGGRRRLRLGGRLGGSGRLLSLGGGRRLRGPRTVPVERSLQTLLLVGEVDDLLVELLRLGCRRRRWRRIG
jgi:hypothetical protein